MTAEQKKNTLMVLFGLSDVQAEQLTAGGKTAGANTMRNKTRTVAKAGSAPTLFRRAVTAMLSWIAINDKGKKIYRENKPNKSKYDWKPDEPNGKSGKSDKGSDDDTDSV